jgi:RND superfamily putative drug exporter
MFEKIGGFSSRYRFPTVIIWLALLVTITLLAPDLADVVSSNQEEFLNDHELSIIAEEAAAKYFPDQSPPSMTVIALKSKTDSLRSASLQAYLAELGDWLEHDLAPGLVTQVLSPTDPALVDQLMSEDAHVAIFFVGFGIPYGGALDDAIAMLREHLQDAPNGLSAYVTGGPAIDLDYEAAALESFDSTFLVTVILVITTLLIIFRSPISPLIPLAVVSVAYGVSRGLVAWLGDSGFPISSFTDTLLVVLLYGAGTDYSLFLVSRFRGLMGQGQSGRTAAKLTIGRVGETITSSAATVVVGMIAMSFAEFGFYANLGPSLAIGIVVVLLAGLTLTPALLAILGHWAFWPRRPAPPTEDGVWGRVSDWVTGRPWWRLALALVLELPLAIYGLGIGRTVNVLADMPDDMGSKVGFEVIADEFGLGEIQPLSVILTEVPDPRSSEGIAYLDARTQELLEMEGVADVRSLALPLGTRDPAAADLLRVQSQLKLIADELDALREEPSDRSSMSDVDLEASNTQMKSLAIYLDELSVSFPDLAGNADLHAARGSVNRIQETIANTEQLLVVSNQLELLTKLTTGTRSQLGQTSSLSVDKLNETIAQITALRTYLVSLTGSHAAISRIDGYEEALAALDDIDATLVSIAEMFLVSTQLELLAETLVGTARLLEDPAAFSRFATSPDLEQGMDGLDTYLTGLVISQPALASYPEFLSAVEQLQSVGTAMAGLRQGLYVSVQLNGLMEQTAALAEELGTNPEALLNQETEPSLAERLDFSGAYLESLGVAFPSLASTLDYQTAANILEEMGIALAAAGSIEPIVVLEQAQQALLILIEALSGLAQTAAESLPEAIFVPQELTSSVASFAGIATDLNAAATDFAELAMTVRQKMPEVIYVPEVALPGAESIPDPSIQLDAALTELIAALEALSTTSANALPDARFLPPDDMVALAADSMGGGMDELAGEIERFQAALYTVADTVSEDAYLVPLALVDGEEEDLLAETLDHYTGTTGEATRLIVVLDDEPYSDEALATVSRLRDWVGQHGNGYVQGITTFFRDIYDVTDRDMTRIMILVLAGIGIVLVVLMRSFVAPIYMLLTILLSYATTLGITRIVFEDILDEKLLYVVPLALFTFLVALGMDYNIFLMGRVKEEVARHGTRNGIRLALSATGGIISSAGIIMAGTFGAMMTSEIMALVQMGFAVAVGVLLDTFLIRTTLLPAIAVLLDAWNWWPGKAPMAAQAPEPAFGD